MEGQVSFLDALLPAGFGRNERLERIAGLLDWSPIEAIVSAVRPGEAGRPPCRALAMFRALLLQQWYGLSDPGLEEALGDRVSFRRFCGFALDERFLLHKQLVDAIASRDGELARQTISLHNLTMPAHGP